MEKKNIAITILTIALIASGVGNIVLYIVVGNIQGPPAPAQTLVIATNYGPSTLDPVYAWDSASNDVLEQVIETLFYYDLNNVDLPRINVLATGYHWADSTHLQIILREGVRFHDGTPFNATAAKWNLDRLLYLTNCTGANHETVAQTQSLWMFTDGVTPIINNVTMVSAYNLTITLNGPYAPLLSILSYINAGMISPTAHAAEATTFIDRGTGHPVGTGPFEFYYLNHNLEVRFERNDGYWDGPAAFSTVIFSIFSEVYTAHNAFINHVVDWNRMPVDQNLALYEADPKIKVHRFTEDTGKPSIVYFYMGFNNQRYNLTWRLAMAHAINYSHVTDVLKSGKAVKAVSAISPGYGASYNSSIVPLAHDLTLARSYMQQMGFGVGFTTDLEWITVAESGSPFLSVWYTYLQGKSFCIDFLDAITEWFKLIGINVWDDEKTLLEIVWMTWDQYSIYTSGWGPDYLDPYNMLDPLFNPASSSNSAQVDDAHLNILMATALAETDEAARNIIYQNIQGYLSRKQFHVPLYNSKILYTHAIDIMGIPYNAMGSLRLYPCYRG